MITEIMKIVKRDTEIIEKGYVELLNNLKIRIRKAQIKAVINVNKEMILLYWEIGNRILERQRKEGWGSKVIDRLSIDLTKNFPEMKGFSSRNLKYMRKFAEEYPDISIVQGPFAQITWYHNITLMEKAKSAQERIWYASQIIKNGWSRNTLVHQIELRLFNRRGRGENNFELTLPKSQSDLALQTLKDPYIFDFLAHTKNMQEKDIEKQLTDHITNFLLELGAGFAYVGKQVHLEISEQDYYIDLLFYHLKLKCYIVIELKAGEFKPEYAGKINFYLSAIDAKVKSVSDNPTIGLILCKTKKKIIAEYSLKSIARPIGISEYKIVKSIPKNLKPSLPSIKDIERELSK